MSVWEWLFRRREREEELEEEIQAHLNMAAHERMEQGETAEQARTSAIREFGNVALVKETTRDMWGFRWMDELLQDLRYGLRMLAKDPGFTAVAVVTLALGIGANTAVFSLIDNLMLRLLPVRDPGQLVELLHRYPGEPRWNAFSKESYEHFRDHNHVFSGLIGFSRSRLLLSRRVSRPETVDGEYVVGDYFSVLGVNPALGRLIDPDDDRTGSGSAVAVISWSYWKSRFQQDPGILGQRIIVQNVPVTIIGVTPREFQGLAPWSRPDVWLPTALQPVIGRPQQVLFGGMALNLIGRLRPGVTLAQARAEMNVLFQFTLDEIEQKSKDPLWRQAKMEIVPAGAGMAYLRDNFAQPLLILMALVGLLLLIACSSIATLLLARGAAREHEMALRVSLGAGRFRLMRQALTESLLLSASGSLVGIVVALFAARYLVRIILSGRPLVGLPSGLTVEVAPDFHVLFFAVGVGLLTGVLFGLVPALRAMATAPAPLLQGGARSRQSRMTRFFGGGLVASQVSLSVVLLSLAGVCALNLADLRNHLGFPRDHLLIVTLDPAHSGYKGEQLPLLDQQLLGRMEALPGVRSATLGSPVPTSGAGASSFVRVEGFEEKPNDRRYVSLSWVAPKYFETLGIPVLAGRGFTFQDGTQAAIVNQAMARYYLSGANPLGRRFTLERDWKNLSDKFYEIVGVVGDAKYLDAHEAPPRTIFPAFQQGSVWSNEFILRTGIRPAAMSADVRRMVGEVLKGVRTERIITMDDQVDASLVPERLIATLSKTFSALGSMIAAIGLYGLLAYSVARRTKEIGVRMALGATRSNVTSMVLRDALVMIAAGLVTGIPIALWARTFAASIIADMPPNTLLPIFWATAGITAVAFVASYIPARRATKVDPMVALRYE